MAAAIDLMVLAADQEGHLAHRILKATHSASRVKVAPGRFELVARVQSVLKLKGMFGPPAKCVSIKSMNKTILARGGAAG